MQSGMQIGILLVFIFLRDRLCQCIWIPSNFLCKDVSTSQVDFQGYVCARARSACAAGQRLEFVLEIKFATKAAFGWTKSDTFT